MGEIRQREARRTRRENERRTFVARLIGALFVAAALAAIGSFMVDAKIWPFDKVSAGETAVSSPITSVDPTESLAATASVEPTPTSTPAPTPTPVTVIVPSLEGESLDAARALLDAANLGIKVDNEETTAAQPGIVLGQEPAPGGATLPGAVITVRVSIGPECDGALATIIAYGGTTTIGTLGNDVIVAAGSGRAEIDAGHGDDRVCLMDDVSGRVDGGPGADRIFGASESDRLDGGDGNDFIDGGGENDVIYGEDSTTTTIDRGDDILLGGAGNDLLFGDRGSDTLNGGPDADSLYGGPDDDVLEDMSTEDGGDAGDGIDTCLGVGFQKGGLMHCENV